MRLFFLFFAVLTIGTLQGRTAGTHQGHVICGLWNVAATDWQYFFYETGDGFMMHKDSTTSDQHFTYHIDSSGVLHRIMIQFDDSLLPPVCFLIEDNDPNTLTIYHLPDTRECPKSPNDANVLSAIWKRSLDGN